MNLKQSLFERNYNQLSESKRDILDEKYSCFICQQIIKKEAPLFCYQCQKICHEKCLSEWDKKMKIQNKDLECPLCKYKLPFEKWNKILNYEENRGNDAVILNKINNYELNNKLRNDNMNKNELFEQSKEKTLEIFKKIFNKIKIIQSLIKIEIDNKLNNIINIKEINNNLDINTLSNIVYEELEKIEYNIKNKENSNNKNEVDGLENKNNNKLKNENEKEKIKEYRNEINLIYYTENEGIINILGYNFVLENKDNVDLIINGLKNLIVEKYNLKKGENIIKIIFKKKIKNFSYMFSDVD